MRIRILLCLALALVNIALYAELRFTPDGNLDPRDHRALLGDSALGIGTLKIDIRRSKGELQACNLRYTHTAYDEIYANGAMVKVNGTVALSKHPKSLFAMFLKLGADELVFPRDMSEEVPFKEKVVPVQHVYMLADGKPINEGDVVFECEDPNYACATSGWGMEGVKSLMEGNFSLGYQPRGGNTDMFVEFGDVVSHEDGQEAMAFIECIGQLLRTELPKD